MKLGIMQPYFYPYLGYFSLIKNTDKFILFDPVQFIRHGWIERNRILKQNEGWQYIAVPLMKHDSKEIIKNIKIDNNKNWREKILAQMTHYKRKAPFYRKTIEVLQEGINCNSQDITHLNFNTLKVTCDYLGIDFNCEIFSEMNITINPVNAADEWALNICKSLGASEYWNPPGGKSFFDQDKYFKNNINIKFQQLNIAFYSQRRGVENFEPGLSILDVMMFCSPDEIKNMLDDYVFI